MPRLEPVMAISLLEQAKAERRHFESIWQEIVDYIDPTRDFQNPSVPIGSDRRSDIWSAIGPRSKSELASALHAYLIRNQWFHLRTHDKVMTSRAVRIWLSESTRRLLSLLDRPSTRFGVTMQETFNELASIGTAVLSVTEDDETVVKFVSRPLNETYILCDSDGNITHHIRLFEMQLRELDEKFGRSNLSPRTQQKLSSAMSNDGKAEALFDKVLIEHIVYKRVGRDPTRSDGPNKKYASEWYEVDEKHHLKESGFDENPFIITRWSRVPGESYGRSPAMECMPDVMMHNAMMKMLVTAMEMSLAPPMMYQANSLEGPVSIQPFGMIPIRRGTAEYPKPYHTGARLESAEVVIAGVSADIQRAFMVDALRLPMNDRMTAEEIRARMNQVLQLYSPVVARLYMELLSPVIQRTFSIAMKRGLLPPIPNELKTPKARLSIDFVSPLAIATRTSELNALLTMNQFTTPLINADPTVLDTVDADKTFRWVGESLNINPIIFRSEREVASRRALRARQQQSMAQAESVKTLSEAVRNTGQGLGALNATAA